MFLSGGSRSRSVYLLGRVVSKICFLRVVGLRFLFSCQLSAEDYSQILRPTKFLISWLRSILKAISGESGFSHASDFFSFFFLTQLEKVLFLRTHVI